MKTILSLFLSLILLCSLQSTAFCKNNHQKNVLFIAVDDLRLELGCYDRSYMITPSIDRLAQNGIRCEQAYCQQAVCAPSRASLLSGCRPDTTRIYDLNHPLRQNMPDVLTLPQFFYERGYRTISLGKIYHHRQDDRPYWDVLESCSLPHYQDPETLKWIQQREKEAKAKGLQGKEKRHFCLGPVTECLDVDDASYGDGLIAEKAIAELKQAHNKPFFMAVGFRKPHLPFIAPKRYWDLYDRDAIAVPPRKKPDGAPDLAFTNWGELRNYSDVSTTDEFISDDCTRKYIHGYRACVSYTDAQIGKLLDTLTETGLDKNTVIVLWGDHGWKLGDYGDWCKHTNFELDTHVPLIFSGPDIPRGTTTKALVELVDIYPTLATLTGHTVPPHCEGVSLVPLFANSKRPWKTAAFSQYPRGKVMGYSMRTGPWRYTEWIHTQTHQVTARELYNHRTSDVAQRNLANDPEYADLVQQFSSQLAAGPSAEKPK